VRGRVFVFENFTFRNGVRGRKSGMGIGYRPKIFGHSSECSLVNRG